MLYTFTSAVGPRVTYAGSVAEEILREAGRSVAPRGVIPATEIEDVVARLRAAAARAEPGQKPGDAPAAPDEEETPPPVPLAHRLVPLFELLERARLAGKDVTWGL